MRGHDVGRKGGLLGADEVHEPLDRSMAVEPLDARLGVVAPTVEQQLADLVLQLRVSASQIGEAAHGVAVEVADELLVDDKPQDLAVRLLANPDLGAGAQPVLEHRQVNPAVDLVDVVDRRGASGAGWRSHAQPFVALSLGIALLSSCASRRTAPESSRRRCAQC